MSTPTGQVTDEIEFMRRVVPLDGARVVELGCGKAELSRRLLERGLVTSVVALEVDQRQHALNLASSAPPGLTFLAGGAEAIPLPAAQFDLAIMLKSLHHVPVAQLDAAMAEIRRVLVPGGFLYVSEPVPGGDFLEIVRLFHDEGIVLAAAHQAIRRAAAAGVLEHAAEHVFETAVEFKDYDDLVRRIVNVTHADRALSGSVAEEVRRRFGQHMTPSGARFVRQMRVNVLRRP